MSDRRLDQDELRNISARTVGHYDGRAEGFWEGTRDHDVSQNIQALLDAIVHEPPYRILDFGCGPGRDLIALTERGHQAVGLDGAARFCEMARANAGCEVWHQDFLALDLPEQDFHGVFANASLFHVPRQELPRVLRELRGALVEDGVLFASNPRGPNLERWNGERFGSYHDLETWRTFMTDAGFTELHHYFRPPGLPRDQQPWLATVWRRSLAPSLKEGGPRLA